MVKLAVAKAQKSMKSASPGFDSRPMQIFAFACIFLLSLSLEMSCLLLYLLENYRNGIYLLVRLSKET